MHSTNYHYIVYMLIKKRMITSSDRLIYNCIIQTSHSSCYPHREFRREERHLTYRTETEGHAGRMPTGWSPRSVRRRSHQ